MVTEVQFIINVCCYSFSYGTLHSACLGSSEKSSCSILQKIQIKENSYALPRKASGLILIPDIPRARGKRHTGIKTLKCCCKG